MPQSNAKLPDIFDYVDYRVFLAEYYSARKALDPKFTHRFISSQVRTTSAGWFSDILKGRTNLSDHHMVILVKLVGLDAGRAEYFESLVRYAQAGSMDEKGLHYRRMLGQKGVKTELIGADQFEFYSAWYHSVIRELLIFHEFRGDYAELGRKLNPALAAADAKRSIQLLTRLGFVKQDSDGKFRAIDGILKKDPNFKALRLVQFLKANSALGTESIERIPKEDRDISALTISLSHTNFRRAKEEIAALRQRLLALADTETAPQKVYQCNFHMFPVTR